MSDVKIPEDGVPPKYLQSMIMSPSWLIPLVMFSMLSGLYYSGLGDYGLFDPWETHYGEVARDMVERGNYIDPFWGSPWDSGEVKRERGGFYSKPPLTMWMMAIGMNLFGFNALGVRALFPLLALFALLSVYLSLNKLIGRTTALFGTLSTALIPSFAFLSHQAVTDGPMVCIVVMGMMALAMALSPQSEGSASAGLRWLTVSLVALATLGQLWVIWPMDRSPDAIYSFADQGSVTHLRYWFIQVFAVARGKGWALVTLLGPLAAVYLYRLSQIKSARHYYFALFFLACGLTVPAKGWLGWAPMGGALVFYLLISREWHWLNYRRVKLGLCTVFFTGHIWVIAMLGGHHPAWVNRFIYHDHINRLFKGVHSTDDGAFEYFFQWVGYGLYPLIALVPLALTLALRSSQTSASEPSADTADDQALSHNQDQDHTKGQTKETERSLMMLLALWAIVGFTLFSKSSTKFHHYIFPVLPALTIMIGVALAKIWKGVFRLNRVMLMTSIGLLLWVGLDVSTPSRAPGQGAQNWVNLFTYKYDRSWPTQATEEEQQTMERAAASEAWRETLSLPLTDTQLMEHSTKLRESEEDRRWNERLITPMRWITIIMLLALISLSGARLWQRRSGVTLAMGAATLACYYALHIYLPTIAPHWSQWELWGEYYQRCETYDRHSLKDESDFRAHLLTFSSRVPSHLEHLPAWCKSPAIAFRMNWRGEAFYTHNTVVPALYTKDLKPILQTWGVWEKWQPNKRFYIFTERSRIKSELERSLPKHLRGKYREVFGEGRRFVLLEVYGDSPPSGEGDGS